MKRDTLMFTTEKTEDRSKKEILTEIYTALEERGYNAIDQMVGYLTSGDPSYITSHNNARNMITKMDRDDLLEEVIKAYLGK
ncbi:MAG: IreB family regulatory phosphoprotein [Peptostreptococcaceae bacterium]|nr:IreB family regulatory phosphoprotein [Peptostreptococcaceae bacterium]